MKIGLRSWYSQLEQQAAIRGATARSQSMSEEQNITRPGHAEIRAASKLHPSSGAWAFFMREIVRLPLDLTPAVVQVIRIEGWQGAKDPLEAIRSEALRIHERAWTRVGPLTKAALAGDCRNGKSTLP